MRQGKHRDPARKAPASNCRTKVNVRDFSQAPQDFSWYPKLEAMIPRILGGKDLRRLSQRVVRARREGRPLIFMMGAHVVKCGLGGLVGDLLRQQVITGVALNGAGAIHDAEIALWGRTSENVEEGLRRGDFGMSRQTAKFFAEAATRCLDREWGLGESLGTMLLEAGAPYRDLSILSTAREVGIPVTVHVAIGTDVVHQHKEADGRAIGHGTMKDFRRFASAIADLRGGVVLNIGSAVILPEVFLKAMAMARNRGADLGDFATANFDMFSSYRPRVNVVERPRLVGGETFNFLGQHEILLPVFLASIWSKLQG